MVGSEGTLGIITQENTRDVSVRTKKSVVNYLYRKLWDLLREAAKKIRSFFRGPATKWRGGGKGLTTKKKNVFIKLFLNFVPKLALKKDQFFCGFPNYYY